MDRLVALAVVAMGALVSSSASAEPPAEVDSISASGGLAAEPEDAAQLLRALVFTSVDGPRRALDAPAPGAPGGPRPSAVFDWVSPVFVWIEPGYAYAETSVSF